MVSPLRSDPSMNTQARHRVPAAAALGAVCLLAAGSPAQQQGQNGLPPGFIHVEGGSVKLGSTLRQLEEVADGFWPGSPQRRKVLMQNIVSELGTSTATVGEYYLHRIEVTNAQYLRFVEKTGHRFPFHWWKRGKPESYESCRAAARTEFKGKLAMLMYWERHFAELPYAIPAGEEQNAVTFVSWDDAQSFCAWAGVRLPEEAEWMRAARGDTERAYVLGETWADSWLERLGLQGAHDKRLKPVGSIPGARGPLGHDDLAGGVWEWTDTTGYFPVSGTDAFQREADRVRDGALTPPARAAERIAKGGSFLSWSDPVQFRIDARGHPDSGETLESLGFRIAVDVAPGRAASRSLLRTPEYRGAFGGSNPRLDDQVGADRYDIDAAGLIEGYHGISIVPRDHLELDRRADLRALREASRDRPLPVAVLVTTEALAKPRLAPGAYAVCYRDSGVPSSLVDALAKARRAKSGAPVPGADVLRGYGVDPEAARKLTARQVKTIRLTGGLEIGVGERQYLFRDASGAFVAALPVDEDVKLDSRYKGAHLAIQLAGEEERFEFRFGARLSEDRPRLAAFELSLTPVQGPSPDRPWHAPAPSRAGR